ncbi:MAG: hypothetical protein JRF63_02990 [Deltaproteobacteria bacterium]|nr:hypothetical protein [Deltaproteobacteria bacterium]
MSEAKRGWLKRIDPKRWADTANNRFVGFGQLLLSLAGIGRAKTKRADASSTRRGHTNRSEANGARYNEMTARLSRLKLKALFDRDPACRRSAAKWFRDRRIDEAQAAIEGSLAIEEDVSVRRELLKTLRAIEPERGLDQGGL